jgi:2-methylcitrate dehydratase PrpD
VTSENISQALAKHIASVRFEDLPSEAVEAAKKSLLDTVGVILAATRLGEGCRHFVELALEFGGRAESSIIGFGKRVPSFMAAFANGSMAHALDYEDTHEQALVHPSASTVPAALAIAEAMGAVSGRKLLAAIAVGNDLVCRLGLAAKVDPRDYGWYMPPILGAFGAVAAASHLLELDNEKILSALSLTLCQATCSAELVYSPRSSVRSVRDAFSAKAGVLGALLAQRGVVGFEQPIDGAAGLYASFFRGQYDPTVLLEGLGRFFEGARVSYKPWPSCRGTHAYIETVLQWREHYGLQPAEVEEIRVRVSPLNRVLCEPPDVKQRPTTPINAKFSLPFVIGVALVYGRVGLEHFSEEALMDREVLAVAKKVQHYVDSSLGSKETGGGALELRARGEVFSEETAFAYGHPDHPMDFNTLLDKFADCARYALRPLPKSTANDLAKMVFSLETLDNGTQIMSYLRSDDTCS